MVTSYSGELWAVHGESGHIVDNWPFYVEDRAFHASPLVVSNINPFSSVFIMATCQQVVPFDL